MTRSVACLFACVVLSMGILVAIMSHYNCTFRYVHETSFLMSQYSPKDDNFTMTLSLAELNLFLQKIKWLA